MNEDKATRYHRLRRRASTLSLAVSTLALVLLVALRLAPALRDALQRLAVATLAASPAAQAMLVVLLDTAILVLLLDLLTFPFSLFRE